MIFRDYWKFEVANFHKLKRLAFWLVSTMILYPSGKNLLANISHWEILNNKNWNPIKTFTNWHAASKWLARALGFVAFSDAGFVRIAERLLRMVPPPDRRHGRRFSRIQQKTRRAASQSFAPVFAAEIEVRSWEANAEKVRACCLLSLVETAASAGWRLYLQNGHARKDEMRRIYWNYWSYNESQKGKE